LTKITKITVSKHRSMTKELVAGEKKER